MKKRNILAENMRRFGTKNLAEQYPSMKDIAGSHISPNSTRFDQNYSLKELEFLEYFLDNPEFAEDTPIQGTFERLIPRLEDASRSDAEKAEEAITVLKFANRSMNTPEAVVQAAIQSIDNSNVLTHVMRMIGTSNLEEWFDRTYKLDPNQQYHRGATIADKFVEFGTY